MITREHPELKFPRHKSDNRSYSYHSWVDHSGRQILENKDTEADIPKKQGNHPRDAQDVTVTVSEDIQHSKAVVIGIEALRGVNCWFGKSTLVATISTPALEDTPSFSIPIRYHPSHDLYTLSINCQPPLGLVSHLSTKILSTLHPSNLVILTSSNNVPSNHPVSMIRTSHHPRAIGGHDADFNPLFSNRGRVSQRDIKARVEVSQDPASHGEIPLLTSPKMIQGIVAAFLEGAERQGLVGTCFVFSSGLVDRLDRRDLKRVVRKIADALKGVNVNIDDLLKGWNRCFGDSEKEKTSK